MNSTQQGGERHRRRAAHCNVTSVVTEPEPEGWRRPVPSPGAYGPADRCPQQALERLAHRERNVAPARLVLGAKPRYARHVAVISSP